MFQKSYTSCFWVLLLGLSFASCKEDCLHYDTAQVDFFSEHPTHEVIAPVFETVTEQILVKEAHQLGATFEIVTETFQIGHAHLLYKIQDSMELHVVQNAETNTIAEIVCYEFFEAQDFQTTEVPAIYQTRTRQKLVSMGTGAEVPAEYAFVSKEILITPGQIIPKSNPEREFRRMNFTSPNDESFEAYIADQLIAMANCKAGSSYQIVE